MEFIEFIECVFPPTVWNVNEATLANREQTNNVCEGCLRKHGWTPTPFAVGPAQRAAAGPGTRRHSTAAGSPRPAASEAH